MAYKFSAQTEEKFQWLLTRYPKKDAVLLPLLHRVQAEVGYLSPEAIEYVAERMELSPARVKEVASFYTMFKLKPQGKYCLQVCHNLSCYLKGADELIEKLKTKLGVKENETTPDGLFTIERAECLASCSTAPVMQVNIWDYHENLNWETLEKIVDSLKEGRFANPDYEMRTKEGSPA